jgi:hypothetical protein
MSEVLVQSEQIPLPGDWFQTERHLVNRVHGLNMLQKDFQLEIYRGFTVVTSLDRADNDYGFFAKKGEFRSLFDFVVHQPRFKGEDCLGVSLPTREEALRQARAEIDKLTAEKP